MQADHIEGLEALIEAFGKEITFEGATMYGLVQTENLSPGDFDLSPNDDAAVTVVVLRSAFPDRLPKIGEVFELGGRFLRIRTVQDYPHRPTVKFSCEVSQ